jgi:glucose/arabinose dehydrogenase
MLGSLTTPRMVLVVALALLAGLLSIAVLWKPASAAVPPTGFQDSQFVAGLEQVTAMEFAPDGSKRLFVTEKDTGNIRVIEWNEVDGTGTLLQEPFATIPNIDTRQTRGLLGITFHPNFGDGTNDYVYAHYTHREGEVSHNRIVRFEADPSNPNVAAQDESGNTLPAEPIFELDKLGTATTHDGGHIEFGNDGYLYIPVGDNKRNKEPPLLNTLKLNNLFGKVLRIEDDGGIPPDNPFLNKTNGKNEAIYARGFRNPFTMAVEPDPAVEPASQNRIYINDVGERTWEEINKLMAGRNYGWPRYEGFEGDRRFKKPVYAYKHTASCRCAISGGVFYYAPEGASTPFPQEYEGDYFFTDLDHGWIRKLENRKASGFATGANSPVDLKVGPDGGLYYLQYGGSVRVIRPEAPAG